MPKHYINSSLDKLVVLGFWPLACWKRDSTLQTSLAKSSVHPLLRHATGPQVLPLVSFQRWLYLP